MLVTGKAAHVGAVPPRRPLYGGRRYPSMRVRVHRAHLERLGAQIQFQGVAGTPIFCPGRSSLAALQGLQLPDQASHSASWRRRESNASSACFRARVFAAPVACRLLAIPPRWRMREFFGRVRASHHSPVTMARRIPGPSRRPTSE